MSEATVKMTGRFVDDTKAKEHKELLKPHVGVTLSRILRNTADSDENLKELDDSWVLTKVGTSKDSLKLQIVGPASAGNIDGFLKWLTKRGAERIQGSYVVTSADIEEQPFLLINGIPVSPDVKIEAFLRNFPGKGRGIDKIDGAGNSPLHYAAENGNAKIAQALLDLGADINATNKRGSTPLFSAIEENRKEIVDFLISKGADTAFTRKKGSRSITVFGGTSDDASAAGEDNGEQETALDYAIAEWAEDIVALMMEKQAPSVRGKRLKIDLDIARDVDRLYAENRYSAYRTAQQLNEKKVPTFDGEEEWSEMDVMKASRLVNP